MKIVILNGSARKGNTLTAINAFAEGVKNLHQVEILQADKLDIGFCKGCGACECHKGCIDRDDTNPTIDKITAADLVVFASPVYWWGISAQLKLIIDKCYCRGTQIKGKKVGVLIVGGSPVEAKQYSIIRDQFECIKNYLDWKILFYRDYYAAGAEDLKNNTDAINELTCLGQSI